jgi:hypothetical protein
MISTYTTTSIITTTVTPTSVTTAPVTPADIMTYSIVPVVAIIIFVVLKQILNSETQKNTKIDRFNNDINVAFLPLLSIFLLSVVAYNAANTLKNVFHLENAEMITLLALIIVVMAITSISVLPNMQQKRTKNKPHPHK